MANIEQIAQVCHEANRAYCITIGDNSQPTWTEAPDWQKDSARNGVKAHLEALDAGTPLPPDHSHNLWLEEKRRDGWTFGPVKDPAKKEHPCFVPYGDLPQEQKVKDYLFASIVHGFHAAARVPEPVAAPA